MAHGFAGSPYSSPVIISCSYQPKSVDNRFGPDFRAFMLRRNIATSQPEATGIVIGVTRRPRHNLVQGSPFGIKYQSLYRFSLRYAVTDGKPFQGPLGVQINHQVESLARAAFVFQVSRPIGGLSRCIARCHVTTV